MVFLQYKSKKDTLAVYAETTFSVSYGSKLLMDTWPMHETQIIGVL